MADTTVNVTTLALNASTANPTGTAIAAANSHVITPTKETSKVAIRLTNTFAGAKVFTIEAGDSPPADAAGQGSLAISLAQDDVVFVVLESARFLKSDGNIRITVAASTTGFIEAIQLP
jgi:hypothetical protein